MHQYFDSHMANTTDFDTNAHSNRFSCTQSKNGSINYNLSINLDNFFIFITLINSSIDAIAANNKRKNT